MKAKEYIIWGIPLGEKEEQILFTLCRSKKEAEKAAEYIERITGATKTRVQEIDLSTKPNFTAAITI